MDTTRQHAQTILSLATGMRGLERGIERSGTRVNVAAYVEIEAFAIANLVAAMEQRKLHEAPIWTDIKTFPAHYFRGKIHGITAGYPCQPFSNAGKRKGTDDPRHLWPYIYEIVKSVEPVWCFFENVPGHLSLGFDEVYKSLSNLGYRVEAGLFSAAEVGAPHIRQRLFILAWSNNGQLRDSMANSFSQCRIIPGIFGVKDYSASTTKSSGALVYSNASKVKRKPFRNEQEISFIRSTSKNVPNSCSIRKSEGSEEYKSKFTNKNGDQWPAPPSIPQAEWEHPRTIEPGLGSPANGDRHRIDILRMLGNGVVEQTAEKAFCHLLKKISCKI